MKILWEVEDAPLDKAPRLRLPERFKHKKFRSPNSFVSFFNVVKGMNEFGWCCSPLGASLDSRDGVGLVSPELVYDVDLHLGDFMTIGFYLKLSSSSPAMDFALGQVFLKKASHKRLDQTHERMRSAKRRSPKEQPRGCISIGKQMIRAEASFVAAARRWGLEMTTQLSPPSPNTD